MKKTTQLQIFDKPDTNIKRGKRKSPAGIVTSDLTRSAYVGDNADVFPLVMKLHVPPGSVVADVTYGKGVFWRKIPPGEYELRATDIATGVDCRDLPYENGSIDCVILDPPYMEGFYRRDKSNLAGAGTHNSFREYYSNGDQYNDAPKYHAAVLDMYIKAGTEAHRVLKEAGRFIVKCQDEIQSGKQNMNHIVIIQYALENGFRVEDLFILVQKNTPIMRHQYQLHARKNHSYFIVFTKIINNR